MPKTAAAEKLTFADLITDVRIFPVNWKGGTLAIVNVVLIDEFVLKDIRIVEGKKGLFVATPQREGTDGEYYDYFHPITAEARTGLHHAILEAWENYEEPPAEEPPKREERSAPKGKAGNDKAGFRGGRR